MNHEHDEKLLADLAATHNAMEEQVKEQEKRLQSQPQILKLEGEDALFLENVMLKKQIAEMSAQLSKKNAEEARIAFQSHLLGKYNVDPRLFQLQVDPTTATVAIVPRQ